jgi:16S rRNA (cytidine1402-2'-O)-methyltransferase
VVIARELTKLYEQFLRGSAKELLEHFKTTSPRGEMVILFNTRIHADKQQSPD